MKNKNIAYAREEAKIYQRYYRPSLNVFNLLRSVIGIFISGSSPATGSYARRR